MIPPELETGQFHTFVSHNWSTGQASTCKTTVSRALFSLVCSQCLQDQARTIKAQLTALCPGLKCWLDVDNMRTKAGTSSTDKASFEQLIDGIQVMVALLTGSIKDGEEYSDYLNSPPCQHELRRALSNGAPVVFVQESASAKLEIQEQHHMSQLCLIGSLLCALIVAADPVHGGISLEAHRRACPQDLLPLLDNGKIIEWHRVRTYQDVSLKLILQDLLQELAVKRTNDSVYLRREVVREPLFLAPPPEGRFHLFGAPHHQTSQRLSRRELVILANVVWVVSACHSL